jgi:Subtilase family
MPKGSETRHPHFILAGFASTERFRSPGGGSSPPIPLQDRAVHGNALLRQLLGLSRPPDLGAAAVMPEPAESPGLQVEFAGFRGIELAFESLPRERSGIELLNVRREGEETYATVLVPEGRLAHFERLLQDYLSERRGAKGQALDHRRLIDTIKEIRAATLRALWTDDPEVFPLDEQQAFWWEAWLPIRGDRKATVEGFRTNAVAQGMRVAFGEINFPERTVLQAYASPAQMKQSLALVNSIAELRRAKETAQFFDSLDPVKQPQWVEALVARAEFPAVTGAAAHVCLLDTGINNGHPLIGPALSDSDLHTIDPAWGTNDAAGHGTGMAGLALFGDLTNVLGHPERVYVYHRLESVKLLRNDWDNGSDAQNHGYLTIEAVARPEVTAPGRKRVFGLAVTSRDNRDRGRPTAWSAAVDKLASDAEGEGAIPRLLIVSGGNVLDPNAWNEYPASNSTDGIHDPGQAWNALTVGAFTNRVTITEAGAEQYKPIAAEGGLSPFSTTSSTWQPQWPLKPDVVLEGGNAGRDTLGAVSMPSLSLLTTHHLPNERLLSTTNATSAATALAARLAAELMSAYPKLRPESIRGLIVHSAEWTGDMRRMFLPVGREPTKSDYLRLVRHCGFGVPSLTRAAWSVSNSLAMIVEEEVQPFGRESRGNPALRDMQLHLLPWPLAELEALSGANVEMRVTLSYFIEPNPSVRGNSRYRYQSHGLRFDVKRPTESIERFRARVNRAARDEEEGTTYEAGEDPGWLLGKQARHRGSLHSDTWRGTAVDLASRGVLAVYPALGWWKTRTRLERYEKAAPYTLIVSIHAPEIEIDLYAAVATVIASRVAVEV